MFGPSLAADGGFETIERRDPFCFVDSFGIAMTVVERGTKRRAIDLDNGGSGDIRSL